MKHSPDAGRIVSEHRADPGAAARGLTTLLLCAVSLTVPIADHTADPAWRALVTDLDANGQATVLETARRDLDRIIDAARGKGPKSG